MLRVWIVPLMRPSFRVKVPIVTTVAISALSGRQSASMAP